jgi:hypothetical protein
MVDVIVFLICLVCAIVFVLAVRDAKPDDDVHDDATPVDFGHSSQNGDDNKEQTDTNKDGVHDTPITDDVDE